MNHERDIDLGRTPSGFKFCPKQDTRHGFRNEREGCMQAGLIKMYFLDRTPGHG